MLRAGIILLGMTAAARAGVPVELPPQQAPESWMEFLVAAGMEPGPAGATPSVQLRASPEHWTLRVLDTSGSEHRVEVAIPTDDAAREDLIWLASSLLQPIRPPVGLIPTPRPGPEPKRTEVSLDRFPPDGREGAKAADTGPQPAPPAPGPKRSEASLESLPQDEGEGAKVADTDQQPAPRAPGPKHSEASLDSLPQDGRDVAAVADTDRQPPTPEPPSLHPSLHAHMAAAGRPGIAPSLAAGLGLSVERNWRLTAGGQFGPRAATIVSDHTMTVSSWQLDLTLSSPALWGWGPHLGPSLSVVHHRFEQPGAGDQVGWVPSAGLALAQPIPLRGNWTLEPRFCVQRDLRTISYLLPGGASEDHQAWVLQGALALVWTSE